MITQDDDKNSIVAKQEAARKEAEKKAADKKAAEKAKSEAADQAKREHQRMLLEKERRAKDMARIDLSVQQGFLRSTESEMDRKKIDLHGLETKANQARFAKENADREVMRIEKQLIEIKTESVKKAKEAQEFDEKSREIKLQITQLEQNRNKYQREIEELQRRTI